MRLIFYTENLIRDSIIHITNPNGLHECIRLELSKELSYIDLPDFNDSTLVLRISGIENHSECRRAETFQDDVLKKKIFKYMKDAYNTSSTTKKKSSTFACDEKVKFSDYSGVVDVLGYQQAYETVIGNLSSAISELFLGFFTLEVLNGTVIKEVALRKLNSNQIETELLPQCFRRVPSMQDIEKCFNLRKKAFFIKAFLTVCIFIAGWYTTTSWLNLPGFSKYVILIICISYFIWIWLGISTEKDGYELLKKNEIVLSHTMNDVFSYKSDEVIDEDISWEKIVEKYDGQFLKKDDSTKK